MDVDSEAMTLYGESHGEACGGSVLGIIIHLIRRWVSRCCGRGVFGVPWQAHSGHKCAPSRRLSSATCCATTRYRSLSHADHR